MAAVLLADAHRNVSGERPPTEACCRCAARGDCAVDYRVGGETSTGRGRKRPRRIGGARIVPEIDVQGQAAELNERVRELEDLLDDKLLSEELDRRYEGREQLEGKPLEQVERGLRAAELLEDPR
jgi:hypothetical protein